MKASYVPFAAKIRRYKHLAKQVNRMLQDGTFRLISPEEQKKLLQKLRQRLKSIGHLFPQRRLREALAGIALLLGTALANPMEAQSFAPPVTSPFGLAAGQTTGWPTFTDIDGDGDLDLFMVSYDYSTYAQNLTFFENIGTPEAPVFVGDSFENNPFGIVMPAYVTTAVFADLDNDGDSDLLLGAYYNTGFHYLENVGTATAPEFAAAQTNPFGLTASGQIQIPTLADLDNDGDLDLISGKEYGQVLYFKNNGTPEVPAFAAPVTNPFGITPPPSIFDFPVLADLDNDGDQDLLFTSYYPGTQIYFTENTGTPAAPAFSAPQAAPFGLTVAGQSFAIPAVGDIDNDGDLDVFTNDYASNTMYFQENTSVNIQFPPTATDGEVTANEDEAYFFSGDDFNFMDVNAADELAAVRIIGLPSLGDLKLNGTAVTDLQEIDAADLPNLSYEALPDDNGSPYTSFGFQVSDGTDWSVNEYVMTINVNPVNDAPTSDDAEINLLSNQTHTFAASDFPFSDVDGDNLQSVKIISLVDRGALQLNGSNVTVNQVIPVASFGQLTYQPVFNEEGVPYTSFDFKVSDGTAESGEVFTMTVNVTGPNATHDARLDAEVVISPNPAADFVQIKIQAARPLDNLHVTVFDETGRVVSAAGFAKQNQVFQQSLDVKDFVPGMYWIKIESGGKWTTLKFVKL